MRIFFGLLLTTLITCDVVRADYALRWSPLTGASAGTPISVDLFLEQSAPDTAISSFGVSGATYTVNQTGVGVIGTAAPNLDFDNFNDPNPPNALLLPIATVTNAGASADVVQTSILGLTAPSGSVKIGTFSINPTVAGIGQLTADLTTADFTVYTNNAFNQLVLASGNLTAPAFNYNFTAVPEPGSVVTCTALASIGVLRRRRRLKPGELDRWKRWRRRHWKTAKTNNKFVSTKNWS